MSNNKLKNWNKKEFIILLLMIFVVVLNAIITNDNPIALISAVCGITYTFIAGKGNPICYLFGVLGSSFYGFLSFQNALWGNLILYVAYYIPMQILGFFQWNKNLKANKQEIIKTKLSFKELRIIAFACSLSILISINILKTLGDLHPVLDSITTILSIAGMYLTVRRTIEQWVVWMIVNFFSVIMWVNVAISGQKVYSTILMWIAYLFLAIYFYKQWGKDFK